MDTISPIILCADDFAMNNGISEAILSLAEAGRLSATSAMVTTAHWPAQAKLAKSLRDRIAVGLHVNLTFGSPLGAMPKLAPEGVLPAPQSIVAKALKGQIDRAEIAAEIERQLNRFEAEFGVPPDFIDGHHHVHVLPVIRAGLMVALKRRFPLGGVLIRDPSDNPASILLRRLAAGKALTVNLLAAGFHALAGANGFVVNLGFSGYSTFGRIPYEQEFESFFRYPGRRHMVMCHPGLLDRASESCDPVVCRRFEEYKVIWAHPGLCHLIWRVDRWNGVVWQDKIHRSESERSQFLSASV